ncbi:hypothetical protein SAMN04488128_101262 [Chitinophaga eiseniae]|uniref:Uncharacterized protein n=1 Tax=Chitinophaga eiseniae TaxID=634771 RepID=A0A1T4KR77_9BACT|nr:hypothetical protein SAMN04488128_101262 [Chitinophaga eiseniae]
MPTLFLVFGDPNELNAIQGKSDAKDRTVPLEAVPYYRPPSREFSRATIVASNWFSKFIRMVLHLLKPTLFMVFGNPNWCCGQTNVLKVRAIHAITCIHFVHSAV